MLDQCADHSETCPTAPAWLLTAMIQPRVVLYSVFVGAAGGAAFWWIGRLQDDPKNSRLFPLKSKLPKSLVS